MKKYIFIFCIVFLPSAYGNKTHDILIELSENERREAFTSYLSKSGENCSVIRTFYQGQTSAGEVFWNVECSNKKKFTISIKNDDVGSTNYLDCNFLKFVANVDCFKKF